MNFLDLPVEIRLQIYAHLLITQVPIRSFRTKALSSAILRTSKQILLEASPVLYCSNKFQLIHEVDKFHDGDRTWDYARAHHYLSRIGGQSHLIRYVAIRFSTFNTGGCDTYHHYFGLNETDIKELTTIRTMCPYIHTLEFLLEDSQPTSDCLPTCSWSPSTHDHFQALALHLKDMPSLEKVIVNLRGYVDENGNPIHYPLPNIPTEAGESSGSSRSQRTRHDDISNMVKSLGFGWFVRMTEMKKPTLRSSDGRRIFYCSKALQVYERWAREEEYERKIEREMAQCSHYARRGFHAWRWN
ncbi:hypothetical protein PG997_014726 [Apiospora hydei]|uniref:F-box domain-containing protein n=1 Tax=Apiospora hydei TaxID=1337664 RepID=A0ABR1UXV2_9PEZI